MEPPISVPMPTGEPPEAKSAASPPEEPPQVRLWLYGFVEVPNIKLQDSESKSVCGTLVLTKGMAP